MSRRTFIRVIAFASSSSDDEDQAEKKRHGSDHEDDNDGGDDDDGDDDDDDDESSGEIASSDLDTDFEADELLVNLKQVCKCLLRLVWLANGD